MKKLLTLLLTLLMVFALVGCNSKKEEPLVIDEPEKQEVVESIVDEPIVGGYVDADDGTLTDELKDIFNTALKGLMGATYEPVELVATQVVAGINYKFLANGTKTTNPVTKGTYYITIYKDLQGNIELLDIETIEEKQEEVKEEVKTQDITQMSFWVVFYDQYGNELQREALKYGTVPEYKSWLPEGFDKWVYKKSGDDVTSFKAITTNTYFKAVCHEVHHSSDGGSDPTPAPTPSPTISTIADVLATVEGGFPEGNKLNESPENAWVGAEGQFAYAYKYNGEAIALNFYNASGYQKYIVLSTEVTAEESCYTATTTNNSKLTFNMKNGKLTSIVFYSTEDVTGERFNGTYAPVAPTPVTYTVTFKPDEEGGEVQDNNSQKVTEITVPSGTTFSVSSNEITIGENVYTAVANSGWAFYSFEPDSGTITGATNIKVNFSQDQP